MGVGCYDMVLGIDESTIAAAGLAEAGNSFKAQDQSGDGWTFAVNPEPRALSLTGVDGGQVAFGLTVSMGITATNDSDPAKSFSTNVPQQIDGQLAVTGNPAQITFELTSLSFALDDPAQSQLLDDYLSGPLIAFWNATAPTIVLPAIVIEGQTLAPPVPSVDTTATGANVLLLFTGFEPVTVEAPDPSGGWPAGVLFVACGSEVPLAAIPGRALPPFSGGNEHNSISYDYSALPLIDSFEFTPGGGNAIPTDAEASGDISLTWHTPSPFPNMSFSGTYAATASVRLDLIITAQPTVPSLEFGITIGHVFDVDVSLDIEDVPIPDSIFGFSLPGVPGVPDDSIGDEIRSELSSAITGTSFSVLTLNLPSGEGALVLDQPAVVQFAGPNGVALLAVTAVPMW